MTLRKGVFAALAVSLLLVTAAWADPECHAGIGGYDECGQWHCYYSGGGNCLICWDEIIVKG